MNAVARAQLTFQMLTLLQKHIRGADALPQRDLIRCAHGVDTCAILTLNESSNRSEIPRTISARNNIEYFVEYSCKMWLSLASIVAAYGLASTGNMISTDTCKMSINSNHMCLIRGVYDTYVYNIALITSKRTNISGSKKEVKPK